MALTVQTIKQARSSADKRTLSTSRRGSSRASARGRRVARPITHPFLRLLRRRSRTRKRTGRTAPKTVAREPDPRVSAAQSPERGTGTRLAPTPQGVAIGAEAENLASLGLRVVWAGAVVEVGAAEFERGQGGGSFCGARSGTPSRGVHSLLPAAGGISELSRQSTELVPSCNPCSSLPTETHSATNVRLRLCAAWGARTRGSTRATTAPCRAPLRRRARRRTPVCEAGAPAQAQLPRRTQPIGSPTRA
jgi:hypothetical protein